MAEAGKHNCYSRRVDKGGDGNIIALWRFSQEENNVRLQDGIFHISTTKPNGEMKHCIYSMSLGTFWCSFTTFDAEANDSFKVDSLMILLNSVLDKEETDESLFHTIRGKPKYLISCVNNLICTRLLLTQ